MRKANVFFRAWGIKKTNPNFKFRKCLILAWRAERLIEKMRGGNVVEFVFIKSDGTLRIANGSLPVSDDVKAVNMAERSPKQNAVVNFFDTDKDGWRSFKTTELLQVF
jgi:hypothetical protein